MKKIIIAAVSLCFVLAVNLYFRAYPVNFPQLKTEAKQAVDLRINQNISRLVNKKLSEFSALTKQGITQALIDRYNLKNKTRIKRQAEKEYSKKKDKYKDDSGNTYLMELDCWHWARYVKNILNHGYPGDSFVGFKQMDDLMVAPLGSPIVPNQFLFYSSAFLYKVFTLFKTVPLSVFLFYLPLFFTAILIVVLYLFCYYHWGNLSAVITSMFVGSSSIFLMRSSCGWFDFDILNLLLPLLVVITYVLAYNNISFKSRVLWVFFSAFWVGLFSFTWPGWWFIFLVIVIYEIFSLLDYSRFKQHLVTLSLFLVFSSLWAFLIMGIGPFVHLVYQIKWSLVLNKSMTDSIWPNVFYTVSELSKLSLPGIMKALGGPYFFICSLFSLLALTIQYVSSSKCAGFKREFILILFFWFACMLFATFRGIRFALFLILPLGISLGWGMHEALGYFKRNNKKILVILIRGLAVIFCVNFYFSLYFRADDLYPLMNDTWYKTLIYLKENTSKDAIINSWWDFGDWFKAVSNRRVIFDGQSQNLPQSYWMARALLSKDEEVSFRILRMLNNGGNNAFEIINKYLNDPLKSVMFMERAILLEPEAVRVRLLKFLPADSAEEVMRILFMKPAQAYLVIDYTMPRITGSISYLGGWNFAKAYLSKNLDKKNRSELIDYLKTIGLDSKTIKRMLVETGYTPRSKIDSWLSQKLKVRGEPLKGSKENGFVLFTEGLVYEPEHRKVYIYNYKEKKYEQPKSLFVFDADKLKETVYADSRINFSVFIFEEDRDYYCVLIDRALAESLLVRFYYLRGAGLKHFKQIKQVKSDEGYIRIFEIDWGGADG